MSKDGKNYRGTTLIDARVFSRERPLVCPVPWGVRLPYLENDEKGLSLFVMPLRSRLVE